MTETTRLTVAGLRRQDWSFFAAMFCAGGVVTALAIGDYVAAPVYAIGTVVFGLLARRWSRMYPAPMPHAMRWILHVSHPGLSARALGRVLEPQPGERLLEIGPGIGHHAFPIAATLGPAGSLDVLDVQPEMLAEVVRRAQERDITNLVATSGDAEKLGYPDATFDGAYLITVLGEIPHPDVALRELARVVKRGGRIVVGELFMDPDFIAPTRLRRLAEAAGLAWRTMAGSRFSYFARLEVP